MNKTLFDKIFDLDNLSHGSYDDLENKKIELYEEYKHNNIFLEAIKGNKTIAKSFAEISEPNEGFGLYFPRMKSRRHNKKVSQLHELVEERGNLRSNGLLYPDNFVNGAIYGGIFAFYVSSAVINFFLEGKINEFNLEAAEETNFIIKYFLTPFASIVAGTICGWNRSERMGECLWQAECIDERIKKYYLNDLKDNSKNILIQK
ncbi:MAG TPA: hypothetical protein VEC16_00495 [Alphaproteobacteria bacterium]|nr:hypothetical protein [Alphaproteobacteria bacterium]